MSKLGQAGERDAGGIAERDNNPAYDPVWSAESISEQDPVQELDTVKAQPRQHLRPPAARSAWHRQRFILDPTRHAGNRR